MDFDTLVDLLDFFEDDSGGQSLDEIFFAEEVPVPEIPQPEPLPEYKPEEYQTPEVTQQEVQELRQQADTARKEGGNEGFMDWWGKLPEKQKESLFRATMSAVGTGAQAALRNVQQQREQEFQREMQERALQEREKERAAAEEARRVAGTPSAYQFNISRGLVGQNMGR